MPGQSYFKFIACCHEPTTSNNKCFAIKAFDIENLSIDIDAIIPKNYSTIVNEFGKMSSLVLIGRPDDLYSVFHSYQDTVARYKNDKTNWQTFMHVSDTFI